MAGGTVGSHFRALLPSLAAASFLALASCGGGSGGSSDSDSDDGNGDPGGGAPALVWYLAFASRGEIQAQSVSPANVYSYEPDSATFAQDAGIGAGAVGVDGFHRVDDDTYYFSLTGPLTLGGVDFSRADIGLSDAGSYSMAFEGAANGLPAGANIDALARADNGDFIFSTDIHVTLGGTAFEDADLIRYDGGGFRLFIGAGAMGLDAAADIDAVSYRSDTEVLVSTETGGNVTGVNYDHDDLLRVSASAGVEAVEFDTGSELASGGDVTALDDNQ